MSKTSMTVSLPQSLRILQELHRTKRYDEAREMSRGLVAAAPGNIEVLNVAAISEMLGGRPDLALPLIERAISLDSRNPVLFRSQAAALKALGRIPEALEAMERQVALISSQPVNLDYKKINRESPAHHLQHRPVNHVHYRKSESLKGLVRASLEADHMNPDDLARVYCMIDNVARTLARGVPGALAELGVYKGVSAKILKTVAPGRMLYLFDPFDGTMSDDLPESDRRRNVFKDTSLDAVKAYVGTDEVVYRQGMFPKTAEGLPADLTFAVVHIDCDTAMPTKAGLEYFYPRLNPGGLLILHDYQNDAWPGVAEAADEFLQDKPESLVVIPDKSSTGILIKLK